MSLSKFKMIPLFSALMEFFNDFTDARISKIRFLLLRFRDGLTDNNECERKKEKFYVKDGSN